MVVEARSYSRISGADLAGERDRHARQLLGEDRAGAALVRLVGEAVQEADGDRLDLLAPAARAADARARAGLVERQQHRAIGGDPLGHAEAQVARHQRLRPLHLDVVLLEAVLPGDLDGIRGSPRW